MVFLITFVCYGCHLHGSELGSVDRDHNIVGSPLLEVDSMRASAARERMDQAPYHLDQIRRAAVLEAIQVCTYRGWGLLAAHVRSSHVHTVVAAEVPPQQIMVAFKAYASRHLNRTGLDEPTRKRWARHGSMRWLWKPEHVSAAVQYVVGEQGVATSLFQSHSV
ncbi:MAG: hypothetical protein WBW33_18665 [Bryobacteraceae bacterium]